MSNIQRLKPTEAVRQAARNSAKIAWNCGQNMVQDPSKLKRNSLIISTLMLVMSRVLMANASALKAQNTSEAPLRQKEAIKTSIREFGGWTLGYIVFRGIENLTKAYLRKTLNFTTNARSDVWTAIKNIKSEFGKAFRRQPNELGKLTVKLAQPFRFNAEFNEDAAAKALQNWRLNGIVSKFLKNGDALQKVEKLYKWFPIAVGAGPAVFLAGYVLERFTQKHSQQVVDAISKRFSKGSPEPSVSSTTQQATDDSFNAYLAQVQRKRAERGLPQSL